MSKSIILLFYGFLSKNMSYDWAPYGVLYLAAKLKENNFTPIIIHEYTNPNYEEIIKKYAKDTIAFGVSAMTGHQITSSIKAIKVFKKYAPNVPIIWGGAHATAVPANVLESKYADYVSVGPGINNFIPFIQNLSKNNFESKTSYVFSKEDLPAIHEKTPKVGVKDSVFDLSNFPKLPLESINYNRLLTNNKVLNYTASFGCPNNCNFCSWGGFHLWNSLPAKQVIEDITYLVRKYKLKSLWFSDSTFFFKRDFWQEITEGILRNNLNIYWRANASYLDLTRLNEDDYKFLEKSGFDRFFVGIENTSPNVLKNMNKKVDADHCTEIFKAISKYDIQLMASIIFMNPYETIEDIIINRKYIDKWLDITPNFKFQTSFLKPYPGTKVAKMVEDLGFVQPKTLEEFGTSPIFNDVYRDVVEQVDWYSKEFSYEYIAKFKELFSVKDNYASPDWNWRANK